MNADESGETRERGKDKGGKHPSRQRSHSAETKEKLLPMMQHINTIKQSTEEKKKKTKDMSSKDERHSSHSEEGRPRTRSSSLPSDETENKSQHPNRIEPISVDKRKRGKSQSDGSGETKDERKDRQARSGEELYETPSSSLPSGIETEEKTRHKSKKNKGSLSSSSGHISRKSEKSKSTSEEDQPSPSKSSLPNETEQNARRSKHISTKLIVGDRTLEQKLSIITGDTAKSDKRRSRSLEDNPHHLSSSLPSTGNETEKKTRRRRQSTGPGTVDRKLVKPISDSTGDPTRKGEKSNSGSGKSAPQQPCSSLPSNETEKKTSCKRGTGSGKVGRKLDQSSSCSKEIIARKSEKPNSHSEKGQPQSLTSSMPRNEAEKKTDRRRCSERITVGRKQVQLLNTSNDNAERETEKSDAPSHEGMPRPPTSSLICVQEIMEDSLHFAKSVSTGTGDSESKSKKRNSHLEEVLSLQDKKDDESNDLQHSAYFGNETRKQDKLDFQLEGGRYHSSRSMIHKSDGKDRCRSYDLLRDRSVSDYSLIPRQRSRIRDRNISGSALMHINFLKDNPKDMTFARRIALKLVDKKWYNPKAGEYGPSKDDIKLALDEENGNGYYARVTKHQYPSLERAWAYFEHVSLPRYIVEPNLEVPKTNCCRRIIYKMKKVESLDRAEPGENKFPTKLYSPISTPLSQMGDFGLGIGLYFSTLRAMTVLMLLAGIISIPNLIYFSGPDYSQSQPGVISLLKGSAICTNQVWVPCPDCNVNDFEGSEDRLAVLNATGANGNTVSLMFALRNDCDGATLQQGLVNYGTLLFFLLGIVVVNAYQRYREIKYDEDEQTAQDYSIVITNPPPDATNPEEWRAFFREKFDDVHVTACTIAVDNDFLVRSLLERRECMQKIELLLEPGTSLDELNLARIAAQIERERSLFDKLLAMVVPGIPELLGRVTILASRVQGLAQQDYPAKNVFITFETEAAQREVLSALSVGLIAAYFNTTKVMAQSPQYLFRGELLLNVHEPEEPSTVRWQDLNAKLPEKLKSLCTTTLSTMGAIVIIALLIYTLHALNATWAALAIAVVNVIFPIFAKLLTQAESHASESSKQTSLYFKISVFRWVNTAIIITIITPFTETIDNKDGLIRSIGAIFFADIVTTNAIQLLDPVGHFQRHFLAPRAATQDLMNLKMQGLEFDLAERYTNMTKILFLTLWYCSIFPGTFFMCSFALFVNFFMDRFSLMVGACVVSSSLVQTVTH